MGALREGSGCVARTRAGRGVCETATRGSSEDAIRRHGPAFRGFVEPRLGIWTPGSQRVRQMQDSARDLERAALSRVEEDLTVWGSGTHNASVLLEGNPLARLAVFRSSSEPPITRARLVEESRFAEAIAAFVRRHRVRVIHSRFTYSLDDLVDGLRHHGDMLSEGAARIRARELLVWARDLWRRILEQCPDTLFVVPAGPFVRLGEDGDVPMSLVAPNLVVVGAVDEYGYPAPFSAFAGESVRLLDLGVGVEGLLPSGERVPLPGTGRAAARVANLAAKIFAVDPSLTPERAITTIIESADPVASPYSGLIPNAARAIERARGHGDAAPPSGHSPAQRRRPR